MARARRSHSFPGEAFIRETHITADQRRRLFDLRELIEYRDLTLLLARRDIAVRYRQTVLGLAWALLQPLGMMLVFTAVLGRLARMPSDGVPYPLFILCGWLPWHFFSSAMNAAGTSIVNNPNLITKVYFPRLVIPVAALGGPSVDFFIASTLVVMVLGWYGQVPGLGALLLPLLYGLAAMVALGIGCFVAGLSVSYRDFRHLMPFVTTLWLWLTPIFYPLSIVPERWQWLLLLNPMTGVVQGMRAAWLGTPLDGTAIGLSALIGAVLLWSGIRFFRGVERRFADLV